MIVVTIAGLAVNIIALFVVGFLIIISTSRGYNVTVDIAAWTLLVLTHPIKLARYLGRRY